MELLSHKLILSFQPPLTFSLYTRPPLFYSSRKTQIISNSIKFVFLYRFFAALIIWAASYLYISNRVLDILLIKTHHPTISR
uniref:Uncharacterized protein n=1 Tax=Salix viminalis TaxID=40686 RepID=A0A6N2MA13_SALVM